MATAAKKPSTKKAVAPTETALIAYKGFDKDLACNPAGKRVQYAVGETYTHKGKVIACSSGFHACENPLDVWNYYDPCGDNRFCKVTLGGSIARNVGDSKIAAGQITVGVELRLPDVIKAGIAWMKEACKADSSVNGNVTSGHSAKNASSGDYATNASSGDYAKNASSGHYAKNASSGHSATNASSGHSAKNASSGDYAKNASSGDYATNASSGDYAKNASSGHYAKNASSGHSATNASSGHSATNASSGDYAKNASSGDSATNASSGDSAYNEATGEHSVIVAAGRETRAKGAKGVWISLAEYAVINRVSRCVGFASGQAGFDGVPADKWLIARGGKLVEA